MTYSTDAVKLTREPLNIVRIDLDTKISGTYEYICDGISPPNDPPIYSCIKSIEWIPQRTDSDGGIGYLGEVVITAMDFNWPGGAGTYFGRLLANNPYFINRKVKIYSGFLSLGDTFSLSNFQERDYFIRDITGPDAQGNVKIKASDILGQTKEATIPRKTNGSLAAALDSSSTVDIDISDETGFPASGHVIINDEIISYTDSVTVDYININLRARAGTTAAAHASGDAVRYVEYYDGNVVDIIEALLINHTDIDTATYINSTDWDNERDTYLSGEDVDLWIIEPTTVDKVIDELCKQTYINVFWDDVNQEIKLKAIGPTLTPSVQWNDTANILDTKVTIKRPQKNIYSQCWVYYGKIDKTSSGNQAKNYKSIHILANSDIETGLGSANIKRIYGEHLPDNASGTASKVASRFISQHSNPIDIQFEVDTKDQESLETGDSVELTTDLIQGTDGMPSTILLRVIEKRALDKNRWRYRCVFSGAEVGSRYPLIGANSLGNYTAESTSNQNTYGFICDTDNEMSNGDDPYLIL